MSRPWSSAVAAGFGLAVLCAGCAAPDLGEAPGRSSISRPSVGTAPGPESPATSPARPRPSLAGTPSPAPPRTSAPADDVPADGGRPALGSALRGRVVTGMPSAGKVVALTFDGGADARAADRVIAALRNGGVAASFFVTGAFAKANPGLMRRLAAIGPVGNHTWDHPHSPAITSESLRGELARAATVIASTTGRDPRPYFRFPFGEYDARTLGVVNAEGYAAIGWSVDSLGWKGTSGGMSATAVTRRVVGAAEPGAIVLMHLGGHPTDGSTLDADALPGVIAAYRKAGYRFVILDALG